MCLSIFGGRGCVVLVVPPSLIAFLSIANVHKIFRDLVKGKTEIILKERQKDITIHLTYFNYRDWRTHNHLTLNIFNLQPCFCKCDLKKLSVSMILSVSLLLMGNQCKIRRRKSSLSFAVCCCDCDYQKLPPVKANAAPPVCIRKI